MMSRQNMRLKSVRRCADRRGVVLVCVLACLTVASTITLLSLSSSMRHRRHLRSHWQLEQTVWLLDAGYHRALKKSQQDPDYRGETWRLDEAFDRSVEARVRITWTSGGGDRESSSLHVVATMEGPGGVTRRSQRWSFMSDPLDKIGK